MADNKEESSDVNKTFLSRTRTRTRLFMQHQMVSYNMAKQNASAVNCYKKTKFVKVS